MGTVNDTKPSWVTEIESKFSGVIKSVRQASSDEFEVIVEAGPHKEILSLLKSYPSGAFEHLADLTAYDEHPKTPRFYVVYELISMSNKVRARIVAVCTSDKDPELDSVTNLWPGANWLEREVFDMYGIHFKGHPDMRRILMPASFKGHPLRKDFIVDYRQTFPHAHGDEAAFDPFGNTVVHSEGTD